MVDEGWSVQSAESQNNATQPEEGLNKYSPTVDSRYRLRPRRLDVGSKCRKLALCLSLLSECDPVRQASPGVQSQGPGKSNDTGKKALHDMHTRTVAQTGALQLRGPAVASLHQAAAVMSAWLLLPLLCFPLLFLLQPVGLGIKI